jgi:hypothetical protein
LYFLKTVICMNRRLKKHCLNFFDGADVLGQSLRAGILLFVVSLIIPVAVYSQPAQITGLHNQAMPNIHNANYNNASSGANTSNKNYLGSSAGTLQGQQYGNFQSSLPGSNSSFNAINQGLGSYPPPPGSAGNGGGLLEDTFGTNANSAPNSSANQIYFKKLSNPQGPVSPEANTNQVINNALQSPQQLASPAVNPTVNPAVNAQGLPSAKKPFWQRIQPSGTKNKLTNNGQSISQKIEEKKKAHESAKQARENILAERQRLQNQSQIQPVQLANLNRKASPWSRAVNKLAGRNTNATWSNSPSFGRRKSRSMSFNSFR